MSDYINVNTDLHLHGLYAGAVSKEMVPKIIGEQAPLKGLNIVGTGDILNNHWLKLIKEQLKPFNESMFEYVNGTKFVLQTEINDAERIHHIIIFPSLSKVAEVREAFKTKCKDLDNEGRPTIHLNAKEVADICIKAGCLIGPSHMFTPYFGMYSKYNSYKDCYGENWKSVYFGELGLSADTNMVDRIGELHNLTFLSNSDAHSPWPNKMGREFNELSIKDISFEEIAKALKREANSKCILNVKFNPLEGKYHKTRCTGCLTFYEPNQAKELKWRCPKCKKSIKKGVDYRVEELATLQPGIHPEHRPKCIHTIPLSEIIALALNIQNAWSIKVQIIWKQFVDRFGNEINVLLNAGIKDIEVLNPEVARYIQFFREDKIKYVPGGAGVYGKLVKPDEEIKIEKYETRQKSLEDF